MLQVFPVPHHLPSACHGVRKLTAEKPWQVEQNSLFTLQEA